jgi:C-terminal processing protease CtpA/Prc
MRIKRNRSNEEIRTPNKILRIAKIPGVAGYGFSVSGGDDIDGLQPRVDKVDPYGAAASAGLQVGDMIVGINGQLYKHAAFLKVRSALRAAESAAQMSLSIYRDFGVTKVPPNPTQGAELHSTPHRARGRPCVTVQVCCNRGACGNGISKAH